jgi:thiol-disulfide isomerase/thioredoxin
VDAPQPAPYIAQVSTVRPDAPSRAGRSAFVAVAALAAVVAFVAFAVGGCVPAGGAPLRSAVPEPSAQPPPKIESRVPDASKGLPAVLAARDIDGARVGPAAPEIRATAVIVFASWCGPCRHELAILGALRDAEPQLRIIGVNAFEDYAERSDDERLRAYVGAHAPWLQVVRADAALLRALGRPSKVPTLFVFDRDGALVRAFLRARRTPPDQAELAAVIRRAIDGGSPGDGGGPRQAPRLTQP